MTDYTKINGTVDRAAVVWRGRDTALIRAGHPTSENAALINVALRHSPYNRIRVSCDGGVWRILHLTSGYIFQFQDTIEIGLMPRGYLLFRGDSVIEIRSVLTPPQSIAARRYDLAIHQISVQKHRATVYLTRSRHKVTTEIRAIWYDNESGFGTRWTPPSLNNTGYIVHNGYFVACWHSTPLPPDQNHKIVDWYALA